MKKTMLIASLVYMSLASCNNGANDGDAATDTTTMSSPAPSTAAPYGDTAKKVNNSGVLSGPDTRTDVDSTTNRR